MPEIKVQLAEIELCSCVYWNSAKNIFDFEVKHISCLGQSGSSFAHVSLLFRFDGILWLIK